MYSVEKVPPRTIISKGKAITSTGNLHLQEVEKIPPLTLISKGKPLNVTTASALPLGFIPKKQQFNLKRVLAPPLTLISKGKQLNSTTTSGIPLALISKGKQSNPTAPNLLNPTTEKGIHIVRGNIPRRQLTAQTRPRLTAQSRPRLTAQSRPRLTADRRRLISQPQYQLTSQKQLVVKKFENVSAPAPFFGTYKSSKIPRLTKAALQQQDEDGENDQNADELSVEIPDFQFPVGYGDENKENTDLSENVSESEYIGPVNTSNENRQNKSRDISDTNIVESCNENEAFNDFVIETADKAVQTECFCNCVSGQNSDINDLTSEIKMLKLLITDLKINISGKNLPKMMSGLFPIKTTRDLEKIEYHIDNTENFEIRLKLHLKYLKPKLSPTIKTAFNELVADEFFDGMNWDGLKGQVPLYKYGFFNTTLFDAWKNSTFTKDVYIDAMKIEIKKAHDRLSQQKHRKRLQASDLL